MASTTGQREDKNHERQEEHEKGASSIALGKVPSCRGDEQAVEPDRRATLDSQSISCPLRLSRARCREPVPLRDRDLRPWNAGYKRRSCLTHERPVRPFVLLILFERGLSMALRDKATRAGEAEALRKPHAPCDAIPASRASATLPSRALRRERSIGDSLCRSAFELATCLRRVGVGWDRNRVAVTRRRHHLLAADAGLPRIDHLRGVPPLFVRRAEDHARVDATATVIRDHRLAMTQAMMNSTEHQLSV